MWLMCVIVVITGKERTVVAGKFFILPLVNSVYTSIDFELSELHMDVIRRNTVGNNK